MTSLITTAIILLTLLAKGLPNHATLEMAQTAEDMLIRAMAWAQAGHSSSLVTLDDHFKYQALAIGDCAKLYEEARPQLARFIEPAEYSYEDATTWLSGALTSHKTCLDGLRERGVGEAPMSQNLTKLMSNMLELHARKSTSKGKRRRSEVHQYNGLLASWNPVTSRADIVVAKDGSGQYKTIKEAVNTLVRSPRKGGRRMVVYVKAGVYNEKIEIGKKLVHLMFVGDGMEKTIVTGNRNFVDGDTTISSATFEVSGDGFWARDMTFENTAGPQKHQAVALRVASDHSLFYRCSFRGYQDTLYVHSLRQFYRDCHIYGTIDFIFGNAIAVFQNCDIFVRKPMAHQANIVTAQGREYPYDVTGISIHGSRVRPALGLAPVKGSFKNYLGRPWKKYSRTIIAKTNLDGLIHPKGWLEWDRSFALATLYYAEYMNTGVGAATAGRVKWPGFHVLHDPKEVKPFTVRNFLLGEAWIIGSGVPVQLDI